MTSSLSSGFVKDATVGALKASHAASGSIAYALAISPACSSYTMQNPRFRDIFNKFAQGKFVNAPAGYSLPAQDRVAISNLLASNGLYIRDRAYENANQNLLAFKYSSNWVDVVNQMNALASNSRLAPPRFTPPVTVGPGQLPPVLDPSRTSVFFLKVAASFNTVPLSMDATAADKKSMASDLSASFGFNAPGRAAPGVEVSFNEKGLMSLLFSYSEGPSPNSQPARLANPPGVSKIGVKFLPIDAKGSSSLLGMRFGGLVLSTNTPSGTAQIAYDRKSVSDKFSPQFISFAYTPAKAMGPFQSAVSFKGTLQFDAKLSRFSIPDLRVVFSSSKAPGASPFSDDLATSQTRLQNHQWTLALSNKAPLNLPEGVASNGKYVVLQYDSLDSFQSQSVSSPNDFSKLGQAFASYSHLDVFSTQDGQHYSLLFNLKTGQPLMVLNLKHVNKDQSAFDGTLGIDPKGLSFLQVSQKLSGDRITRVVPSSPSDSATSNPSGSGLMMTSFDASKTRVFFTLSRNPKNANAYVANWGVGLTPGSSENANEVVVSFSQKGLDLPLLTKSTVASLSASIQSSVITGSQLTTAQLTARNALQNLNPKAIATIIEKAVAAANDPKTPLSSLALSNSKPIVSQFLDAASLNALPNDVQGVVTLPDSLSNNQITDACSLSNDGSEVYCIIPSGGYSSTISPVLQRFLGAKNVIFKEIAETGKAKVEYSYKGSKPIFEEILPGEKGPGSGVNFEEPLCGTAFGSFFFKQNPDGIKHA